jgi:hypothetical protein
MKKSAKFLCFWLFVSLSCLGGWTAYAQTSNSQHQVTVPATRRDDPLGIESSNETTAKSSNKLVGKGYDVLEPAKQSKPASKLTFTEDDFKDAKPASSEWQPPEGDEIIKRTKIPRWDDTTPLPAKTPMTAKQSASDFLDVPDEVAGKKTQTDWGNEVDVVCGVTLGVTLAALFVLIIFSLIRYVRHMKISVSKHNPQRIVLGLGLLLVLLNGLFPPFETQSRYNLGYHFLFTPPSTSSHIVTSLFFIQFVTIVGATAGAFFLFGMRDKKGTAQGKIQEAANQPVETVLKDERSDIPPPAKPVTENVQTAAPVRELTPPNNETLPVHEPQTEQKQADLQNTTIAVDVFFDLQESLNLNPSREQWEYEFLTRINPQQPIPSDTMDALWKSAKDAKRQPQASIIENAKTRTPIPAWQPSARILFRLRLVSALLLAASFSILLYVLMGSHGDTQKISDLLVNLVGKSGIAAFLLWFSFGKKKGFGVLLFAIFCFLFAVFIGWGVAKIKKEDASVEKLASNAVALMEQMTNSDNFTPQTTGNKNMDQVMSLLAKYGAFFKQLSTDMDSELQNVGEPNIYSEVILNYKEKIRASISIQSKRQTIIETYRAKGHDGIERTALELSKMNISDSTAKGMVEGFNGTLEKAGPLMDEIFTLRSNMESAKAHFLQFMLDRFGDYKSNGAAIVFSKNEDLKQYKALTKVVEDDTKAVDDWTAKQVGSANSVKERLKKIAQ